MSEAIDKLRARNRHDVTLPSGITVTLKLPKVTDYIGIMGTIPTPILEKAAEGSESEMEEAGRQLIQQANADEQRGLFEALDKLVNITVVAIEGSPLEEGDTPANELDLADCTEIVKYAQRKPGYELPKAPSESMPSEPLRSLQAAGYMPQAVNGTASTRPDSWQTTSSQPTSALD